MPGLPLKSLKWYRDLASRKGRDTAGAFLLEGEKSIRQLMENHPEAITEILSVESLSPIYDRYPRRPVSVSQMKIISTAQTPPGMVAVISLPPDVYNRDLPSATGNKILLLEDVQDPGNVGNLIRTAVFFGYGGVILTEKCADPFSPKCVQAAIGAVLSLWLRRTAGYMEMVQSMQKQGYTLLAADVDGNDAPVLLTRFEKMILALGNEAAGVSKTLLSMADHVVQVPGNRQKAESLNVAACGAICMYLSCRPE